MLQMEETMRQECRISLWTAAELTGLGLARSSRNQHPVQRAELDGLQDVVRPDVRRFSQVRQRAGDFQNPVVRAGGEIHLLLSVFELASEVSLQCCRTRREPMEEFVELEDFRNRSSRISRAAITRWRIVSEDSPVLVLEVSSRKFTRGTSTCKSIRSNSGPEIRWR